MPSFVQNRLIPTGDGLTFTSPLAQATTSPHNALRPTLQPFCHPPCPLATTAPDPRSNPFYANPTTIEGIHRLGKDFINRGKYMLGKLGYRTPEEVRFLQFYGAPAVVVMDAWKEQAYLP